MRPVSIANRHPRLRLDRRAIARVIHTLDAHAHVFDPTRPSARASVRKSKIQNRKSKILSGPPAGELSLVFLTDAALAKLHADFLDDPTTTDVITFEGDPALGSSAGAGSAGEICVSADAALRHVGLPPASSEASREKRFVGKPPSGTARRQAPALQIAFSAELTLYVVHGWLHLAGYDDLNPAAKRAMRRAEARAMRLLAGSAALPRFKLA
jgi:probable rRNA maturation factor